MIVVADAAKGGFEIAGESGLALLRQLAAIDMAAPVVCAGASHAWLISRAANELHVREGRIVGSAPLALESALRALTGLAMDASGAAVELAIAGVPPNRTVVAWEEASAFGQPLAAHLAPHAIAKLNDRLADLWPPGPYVLASAAARVVEALVTGSRRRLTCFVPLDRGHVSARPVELGPDGVVRVLQPVLTRQEQTRLENAVES